MKYKGLFVLIFGFYYPIFIEAFQMMDGMQRGWYLLLNALIMWLYSLVGDDNDKRRN